MPSTGHGFCRSTKSFFSKMFDNVIAFDLRFGPLSIKNPGYAYDQGVVWTHAIRVVVKTTPFVAILCFIFILLTIILVLSFELVVSAALGLVRCDVLRTSCFPRDLQWLRAQTISVSFVFERLVRSRGGVEDTRLEAKAKDTKKIRGQGQGLGQPFRGQTLSRPRTGMLKDQGHKRKCSPKKKKGLHKNFSGDLQKKRSSQKFFKRSPQKNVFQKIFQALHRNLTIQKMLLS